MEGFKCERGIMTHCDIEDFLEIMEFKNSNILEIN